MKVVNENLVVCYNFEWPKKSMIMDLMLTSQGKTIAIQLSQIYHIDSNQHCLSKLFLDVSAKLNRQF